MKKKRGEGRKEKKRGCSFESGEHYTGPQEVSLVLALMSGSVVGAGKERKVRKGKASKEARTVA